VSVPEVAVLGLGASGQAAARLLLRDGRAVYASDGAPSASGGDLASHGVVVDIGAHDLARIARAELVVASPGIPPLAPPLAAARAAGVPIISEIELALRAMPGLRYIAVTGTNGKTTTTALIGHLLRGLGYDAVDAGNIGVPLAEVALRPRRPDWVALELSSFQLHDTPSVNPTVGVLTNLSPDHLDRYASVDEYYADKARLFSNASAQSNWVLNYDDLLAMEMGSAVPGRHYHFSSRGSRAEARFDRDWRSLEVFGAPLLQRMDLHLIGDHNVANALAAALAVIVADEAHLTNEARAKMAESLATFRALGHRLQIVGEFGGVQWIDDSKATNVSSALVALEGMTQPTILLAGGRHKGEPYTALAEPLQKIGKMVLAYGEAAPEIVHDLGGLVPVERMGRDFVEVVARARSLAEPGDAVLLSPACSSFDMFRNYAERGDTFARLAKQGS
jgi:UDP-N-acetylmuramoylalanine--D-glutamate ligase